MTLIHEMLSIATSIAEGLLSKARWYRRLRGGHWEQWWIMPPVASTVWIQNNHGERPWGGGILDACEDHTRPPKELGGHPYRTGQGNAMNSMDYGKFIALMEKLAGEVNRDYPGTSLDARVKHAMRRCKGHMNPKMVREALIRTPPCPTSPSPGGDAK